MPDTVRALIPGATCNGAEEARECPLAPEPRRAGRPAGHALPLRATFAVHGRLPGLNEIIAEARTSRYSGARQKLLTEQAVMYAIQAAHLPSFTGPITVAFAWHEPDLRRDPDNIRAGAKFLLDALVRLGVIAGDGHAVIKGLSDTYSKDKQYPRVEVVIEAVS